MESQSSATTNDLWNFQQRKEAAGQMMQSITSQWQNSKSSREQMLKTTQKGLVTLGTKLQQGSQDLLARNETQRLKEQFQNVVERTKINNLKLSKFTMEASNTSTTSNKGGITDQLEMFNERMKEEALRRDVRREAEEACLQTMRDHLSEFLQDQKEGTYEEWIFALHPENTQDASLLHDMEYKEVDSRFYVEESDHRQLWNETVVKDPHRQIVARTRMWNSSNSQNEQQPMVDLLGSSEIQVTSSQPDLDSASTTKTTTTTDPFDHATGRSVTEESPAMDPIASTTGSIHHDGDLISF